VPQRLAFEKLMSASADIRECRRTLTFKQQEIMRVRTPSELGALIRDYRTRNKLDQKSLAATVGVSRQWIVEMEKGKAGAPLGLVLRTLGTLGIVLDAQQETPPSPKDKNKSHGVDAFIDINSIVSRARKKRK
jgi:HTH-type transcriptional regulator / antitoxin HipB